MQKIQFLKFINLISIFLIIGVFSCTMAQEKTKGDQLISIASTYLNKPYVAGTLEGETEVLVCNLKEFDCFTLVENVLALANSSTDKDYQDMVKKLRYRNGEVEGYASRIHYFSEWADHAEKLGYVNNATRNLGEKVDKKINFMSTHRQYYPAFKTNEEVFSQIKFMEENNADIDLYTIPKGNIKQVKREIKTGDIIAFTSNINGLDVNHVGFAYWKGQELHFLHASSENKKVEISSETLEAYLNRLKKHSGIMVLQPI